MLSDLINLLDPPVDPIEGPAVGDVIHQDYSLKSIKMFLNSHKTNIQPDFMGDQTKCTLMHPFYPAQLLQN